MTNCKKCDSSGTIILRHKDYYCENCFITNLNHKFRACIGKNRAISPHESVLACLSGGTSSTVLLDMIHNGISLSNHKKLRITPYFLHLTDNSVIKNSEQIANNVINQCESYGFKVYLVDMSEYIQKRSILPEANRVPAYDNMVEYQTMLKSMPATVRNDFIAKIRRHLSIRTAKQLQCNCIFTAESTATLAISLLSNLSLGRGAQVQDDVSFCDARDSNVKIFRPMKDITKEELQHYVKIKKLHPIDAENVKENGIQSVIGKFVTELQDSFQATISTVCKTADKIGSHKIAQTNTNKKCVFCESDLTSNNTKLTALDATNFSRLVSLKSSQDSNNIEMLQNLSDENSMKKSIFPYLNEHLCYGCSRSYLEMDKSKLPQHIQEEFQSSIQ